MATINKKYLDEQGLSTVANYIKERLKAVDTMPATAGNGTVVLYKGTTSGSYTNGHIYQYSTTTSSWTDISPAGGSGSGDMTKAVYDNDNTVAAAGGIVSYVAGQIPKELTQTTYSDSSGIRTFTFTDASITTTKRIDYYANIYGIAPDSVVVSTGSAQVKFKVADRITECGITIK